MSQRIFLLAIIGWAGLVAGAAGRPWTDSTARYGIEAGLIAFDDETVILKNENRELVAIPLARLSKHSRETLGSLRAQ